jgi:hypothetical protein
MIKRAIDQKQKQNVEQAAQGGLNIIAGILNNDYSGIKKGVNEMQTTDLQEEDEKKVKQRMQLLHNLKMMNETEKMANEFDKNMVETIDITKNNSAKLAE